MQVREIMTRDVKTVSPDTKLAEAAGIMRQLNVGVLPVVENDEIVGVVTDRDIVVRCVAKGHNSSQCSVGEVMSADVVTCPPQASLEEAAKTMRQRQIRRLIVADESGGCVGVLALGDLAVTGDKDLAGEVIRDVSKPVRSRRKPQEAAARKK